MATTYATGKCRRCGGKPTRKAGVRCRNCIDAGLCSIPECPKPAARAGDSTLTLCATHVMRRYVGCGIACGKCSRCHKSMRIGANAKGNQTCRRCRREMLAGICSVAGCKRPLKRSAQGSGNPSTAGQSYCDAHDRRRWRNGSPTSGTCRRCKGAYERPEIGKSETLCPTCRAIPIATSHADPVG